MTPGCFYAKPFSLPAVIIFSAGKALLKQPLLSPPPGQSGQIYCPYVNRPLADPSL